MNTSKEIEPTDSFRAEPLDIILGSQCLTVSSEAAKKFSEDMYELEQRALCGSGGIEALRATNDAMVEMIRKPTSFARD